MDSSTSSDEVALLSDEDPSDSSPVFVRQREPVIIRDDSESAERDF